MNHLEEFIDVDVENISHEEFQLRASKSSSDVTIKKLRDLKEVWNKSPDGGRLLQRNISRIKRLEAEIKQCLDETTRSNKTAEREALNNEVNTLVATREDYTQQISKLDKSLKDASSRLDALTKSRRNCEESVYTAVDKIFQSIGANRAHYFGRAFEGVDIKKIMAKSDDLFGVGGAIRQKLLEHTSNSDKDVIINTVCHNVGLAFKLWDGVFSAIHSPNPTVQHCMDTQGRIDKAMEHIRSMGFSITPKMHGMESHVARQMRTIPGGIGKLMEHWIEQYHQTGFRFDMAYCRVGSLVGQAAIRSSAEKRARNPRVQISKMLLQKSFVGIRKRRSAAIESDEKKTQIKQERRDNALAEISATIELDKKEAILAKLKVDEDTEDLDELAKLETKLFGENIHSSLTHLP